MLSSLSPPLFSINNRSSNKKKNTQQGINKLYLSATIPTSQANKKLNLVQETDNLDIVEEVRGLSTSLSTYTEAIANLESDGGFRKISEFNDLFMALVAAQEFELALQFYFNLPFYGLSPDNCTYSTLIACYCDKNEPNEAMIILNHVLEKGFQLNVASFTTLINSFCKKGKMRDAFQVFDIMGRSGCEPTINTYNCLLKGLCYTGKVEEAYELLKSIKNCSKKPDIYSYTAVMDGLCKVSRSNEALELLFDAMQMELIPNVVTYNTLFNGYFKEGTPLKVIHLSKHMKDINCIPNYFSYSTLLHGLLKFGEIRESFQIYKEMTLVGFEVDERMTNTLARGLCRRSRREKELLKDAYEVFGRMRNVGCVIYPLTFDLVIEAFCRGKESEKAALNLYEIVKMGYSPQTMTFEYAIKTLCVEGKVDEAISVLFLMEETGNFPSYISFNILITELSSQKMLSRACVIFGAAMKRGIQIRKKPGKHIA